MAESLVPSGAYWVVRFVVLLFNAGRGRAFVRRLARRFGRLAVVVEPQVPVTFHGADPPFDMLSVLVRNQGGRDADQVRCDVQWRRLGQTLDTRTTTGTWINTQAADMSSFAGLPEETCTLQSNGFPERMPMLVKYPGDVNAYIPVPALRRC